MSTHAIGPVRLLLGSLALMLVGAALCWWLYVRVAGEAILVIRDGLFEIEPWTGTLQPSGSDLVWDHEPTDVELALYRSTGGEEEELELGEPVSLQGVKTIRIDFRVAGGLSVADAVVLTMKDGLLRIAVRNGRLERRGDVWVHQGFVLESQKKRFQISKIEFLDDGGDVVSRYQNPDQGRRVRFRLKLKATLGD